MTYQALFFYKKKKKSKKKKKKMITHLLVPSFVWSMLSATEKLALNQKCIRDKRS